MADPSLAADVSWTNATGGAWSTPGNWSTNSVPGASDRALITLPGTYTVTIDVDPSVTAIFLGAGSGQQTLAASSRTLSVTDSISVDPSGVLDLTNSTVSGRLADRALVIARRASILSGQTNVETGATLRVLGSSGASANVTFGPVADRGTIELTSIDGIFQSNVSGAGPVTISAGGVLHTLAGTGGARNLSVPLVNRGSIVLDAVLSLNNAGLSQLNDVGGTLDASNADLILTQNGSSSFSNQGTLTIGLGHTISVSAGTFANSGTLAGAGSLVIASATVNGSMAPAASLLVDLTSCTVNATVTNLGLLVVHGASTLTGAVTNSAGATFRNLGGSVGSANLTLSNTVTNQGTFELTSAAGNFQSNLQGAGSLINQAGGLLVTRLGTGGNRNIQVAVTNQGAWTIEGPTSLNDFGVSQLNDVGGTLTLSSADVVVSQSGGASFSNLGTINIPAGRTFSLSANTFANSGSLLGSGSLVLGGATVTGTLAPPASLLVDLTNCTVNATVTNQGLMVVHKSNTFSGTLTNVSGATFRNFGAAGGSAILTLSNTVTNQGTFELTSADGNLQSNLQGVGPLINQAGGLLVSRLGTGGDRHVQVPVTNQGAWTAEGPMYVDDFGVSALNDVGGVINLTTGDFVVSQSPASQTFNNKGTINIGSGRTCSFSGGILTNTGTFSGAGSLSMAALTANFNTSLTFTLAGVSIVSSTVNAPQALTNGPGTTLTIDASTVNGALTDQGTLVTRRTTTLNGALTNASGSTLRVLGASGGSANLILGATTNHGTIELTSQDGNFQSTLSGAGSLTNASDGLIHTLNGSGGERHFQLPIVNQGTITSDAVLYDDNGTLAQLNDVGGTLNLAGGDVVLTQSGTGNFTNRGTITVGSGRTLSVSGGTFLNDVAGTLNGTGTISSSGPDLTNAGTISPGSGTGRLTFNGKVVQTATGRVRIELSGTQPITQYDVLQCSGQAVLGGTLQVVLLGGFVPPAGAPFAVLKYGTRTGTFASYEGLDLGGTLQFSPTYTDTAMILSTGPLAIVSVTPNHGGQGKASCVVHGAGFFPGLTAKLVRGTSQIPGTLLGVSSLGIGFGVTFDLTGAQLGAWDLVIQGADGTTVTLPGGFTVEALRPAWVSVQIVGSPIIRVGRPASFEFVYTNNGNVDAIGVPVYIDGLPAGSSGPSYGPTPTVPGASPIDYNSFPSSFGPPSGSTAAAAILPRVPPGISVRLRVTVQSNTSTSFPVRSWVNPAFFTPGLDPKELGCYIAIMDAALECGGLIPGLSGDCIQHMVELYFSTVLSVSGTGLAIVDPNGDEPEVAISMLDTMVGVTVSSFETISECVIDDIADPLKIYNAFMCGWSTGQAFEECSKLFTHDGEAFTIVSAVTGHDPNEKVGPAGIGVARFVRNSEPIPYLIDFENSENASAPAQEVVVADTLDATKVDVSTVALGPIRFGSHVLVPPPGATSFLGTVDLRPTTNLIVKADVRLDSGAGVLTWRLSSIDPATGAPPTDPLAGFLPPDVAPPQGEGSVQYTVLPRSSVTTNEVIANRASIVFDTNPAILTPVWTNTFDATPPTSAVDPLPAVTQTLSIPVTWGGSDVGSGLRDFTIHVSVDGGPDSVWLDRVTETSGYFAGSPGHSYAFYSEARDSTFLSEAAPPQPDAQTTISSSVGVVEKKFIFALRGALPNPADSRVLISFELPATLPGSLDLFDLGGRRVAHREIGGFAPGVYSIHLGDGERIHPGIYFVRLRHGSRTAIKKVVVSH